MNFITGHVNQPVCRFCYEGVKSLPMLGYDILFDCAEKRSSGYLKSRPGETRLSFKESKRRGNELSGFSMRILLMGSRTDEVRSMMEKLERKSYIKAQESDRFSELKSSFYTVHSPGEYTTELPYRDYPVVEAADGMTAQIVSGWIQRLDEEVEQIDGVAWAIFVPV
ncbi:hypothetical protein M0R89_10480 [Halorussus limi]|uniref:Uncharacterized protein n=1 Tax=Halorussus limi TaxID=2938695 RepID=A0A8U0HQM2_9EURY|nr:hypothetical protein [Halorussus limi]UPV72974.1 hypothetical protein M0R89_10480 [Halorussus limi]